MITKTRCTNSTYKIEIKLEKIRGNNIKKVQEKVQFTCYKYGIVDCRYEFALC